MEADIITLNEQPDSGMSQLSSAETVSGIRNRAIEVLRIRHNYLLDWNAREAFRECYQNLIVLSNYYLRVN